MTRSFSARSTAVLTTVAAATAPSAALFRASLFEPERAQLRRLRAVLDAVRGTRVMVRHRSLGRVRTPAELQDELPLCRYEDFVDDIEDQKRGVPRVLTYASVTRFERTGGSTGTAKDVPYTAPFSAELQRALLPWIHDVLQSRPAVKRGACYWSISPQARPELRTSGGVSVGSDDDTAYFPRPLARALDAVIAVPAGVARLPDVDSCRYATLRLLLARPDLRMMSVWSPTFLSLLLDGLGEHGERLVEDLAAGTCRPPGADGRLLAACAELPLPPWPARARALSRTMASTGELPASVVWPRLSLVSLWTDAHAAHFLPDIRRRLPGVELQGKGLLATEGVTTIPLFGAPAPVLAVRSHFYEFLDVDNPAARPALAHELAAGRTYEVVLSTSAGLLRYRIGDLVRVEGYLEETPCLRFVGRADDVSDLVGEKLSAARAQLILDEALRGLQPSFSLIAPELGPPPRYTLFLEGALNDADVNDAARRAEELLLECFHYRYARELGQLAPLRGQRVVDGARTFEARRTLRGQRAGDVKPAVFDRDLGWREAFSRARERA